MALPYMESIVGFIIVMYIFETYLNLRQLTTLKLPTLPKTLVGVISQENFEKSRTYSLNKSYLHLVQEFVNILNDSTMFFFVILPWFWKITNLPAYFYSTFVIESRHGFNKQTIRMVIKEMIKETLFYVILGATIAPIIYILQKGGPYLAIYLWAFNLILSLVMMQIYPVLITPLFDTFTPMETLRRKLRNLLLQEFWSFVRNTTDFFRSFGFDTQPVVIGLLIFMTVVIPLRHLVSFGLNLVSRAFEFQADAFAVKLGYANDLRHALVKIQEEKEEEEENLSSMNDDPLYSAYHYSHPPLVERLQAIDGLDKKTD